MNISEEEKNRLKSIYNEEQFEAIISPLPLTIIAGPGSGKTTTIVEKISQSIENFDDLKRTLVITFTNEASRNIIRRLNIKLDLDEPIKQSQFYIGTFHGIFFKFLYENFEYVVKYLDFEKKLHIVEPQDDLKLFNKFVTKYYNKDGKLNKKDLDEKFTNIHYITIKDFYYSILKEINKAPTSISELHDKIMTKTETFNKKDKELFSLIIKEFFDYKREEGVLSFNDILLYTYFLIFNVVEFKTLIQTKFDRIFIDEYQDTNPIQDRLIGLLKKDNDCEVGDGYQSIYKFLNADITNILNLIKEPGRNVIQLTKNYRSSPNIVEFTNDITTLFKEKIPNYKECTSENKTVKNLKIEVKEYVNQEYKILNHIQKSLRNGIKPHEISIISRANYETMRMEKLLLENKIPFIKLSGKSFYERKEIITLIDLLKILIKKYNIVNFENIAEFMGGLGTKTIEKVSATYMERTNKKEKIQDIIEREFQKNKKLSEVSQIIFSNKEVNFHLLTEILNNNILNIKKQLIENGSTISAKREIERNIENFLNEIQPILVTDDLKELEEFLSIVSLDKKEKSKDDRDNSIIITTAHSSKGLEWQNCYILNATDGMFPSERSMSLEEEVEEEKRLFYVAVSRAKEFLMITSNKELNSFVKPFVNSRYIDYEVETRQNDFNSWGENKWF